MFPSSYLALVECFAGSIRPGEQREDRNRDRVVLEIVDWNLSRRHWRLRLRS